MFLMQGQCRSAVPPKTEKISLQFLRNPCQDSSFAEKDDEKKKTAYSSDWPRSELYDVHPIVNVKSVASTRIFPEYCVNDDDAMTSPAVDVVVVVVDDACEKAPVVVRPSPAPPSEEVQLRLKAEKKKKSSSCCSGALTTTPETATTKQQQRICCQTSSFACTVCGHEFALRKTRDMHAKTCMRGQNQ